MKGGAEARIHCFSNEEISIIFDILYENSENKDLFKRAEEKHRAIKVILPQIAADKKRAAEEYDVKMQNYTDALNYFLEQTNDEMIKSLLPQRNMGNPNPPSKFDKAMVYDLYSSESEKRKIDEILRKYD